MRHQQIYSPKNIVLLGCVFVVVFFLLFSLGSHIYKTGAVHEEIELIRQQNEENLQTIEEKKRYLAYLKTPQRIDKEAKMQMGKKNPGEKTLVFIEEKIDILPTQPERIDRKTVLQEDIPIKLKWQWVFFGR